MRQNKIHDFTLADKNWLFSKILQIRTGSDSFLSDQDWTQTEKFHSPLISGMYIKYLLATLPQMVHNLCGVLHLQVESHWSKLYQENKVFSITERVLHQNYAWDPVLYQLSSNSHIMYYSMHTLVPNQTSIYDGTILQKVHVWSQKICIVIDQWFLNGVCVPFGVVVFNLFHTAPHFSTQFNLTTPFQKFPVVHMQCSCVCAIENHSD